MNNLSVKFLEFAKIILNLSSIFEKEDSIIQYTKTPEDLQVFIAKLEETLRLLTQTINQIQSEALDMYLSIKLKGEIHVNNVVNLSENNKEGPY